MSDDLLRIARDIAARGVEAARVYLNPDTYRAFMHSRHMRAGRIALGKVPR